MSKTGRNAPCPCGSGKKFKRCCGNPDKVRTIPTPVPERRAHGPDLRALDSEQIRRELGRWGIATDRESFRAEAAGFDAAQSVAENWLGSIAPEHRGSVDADFIFAAAIELWRRDCPDRPSTEMLAAWIDEGYEFDHRGEFAAACAVWSRVCDNVFDQLRLSVRTLREADDALGWDDHLGNVVGDLLIAYLNAGKGDPSVAEQGVRFARQVRARFDRESPDFLAAVRADLAEFLHDAGRREEAERELETLIAERPDAAGGYCRLADLYEQSNPRRALAILERAAAVPVQDGAGYGLDARISALRSADSR